MILSLTNEELKAIRNSLYSSNNIIINEHLQWNKKDHVASDEFLNEEFETNKKLIAYLSTKIEDNY